MSAIFFSVIEAHECIALSRRARADVDTGTSRATFLPREKKPGYIRLSAYGTAIFCLSAARSKTAERHKALCHRVAVTRADNAAPRYTQLASGVDL